MESVKEITYLQGADRQFLFPRNIHKKVEKKSKMFPIWNVVKLDVEDEFDLELHYNLQW